MNEIENKNIVTRQGPDILDPKRIINKIIQNWYYFTASIILALVISHYLTNKSTPIYAIEGTLLISEDQNTMGLDLFSSATPTLKNTQVENQIVYLGTYSLALKTIKDLNINVNYFIEDVWGYQQIFNQEIPVLVEVNWNHTQLNNVYFKIVPGKGKEYLVELLQTDNKGSFNRENDSDDREIPLISQDLLNNYKGEYGEILKTDYFEFTLYKLNNFSQEIFFSFSDDKSLAKKYRDQVKISPVSTESSVLKVQLNNPDQIVGSEYVNALMKAFLRNDLEQKNLATQQTLDFIENQILTINDSINLYENEIQNFRKINQIINISAKGTNILSESVKLEEELNRQNGTLEYYRNLKKYLDKPEGQELLIPSIAGIEDPIINTMVTELITLQNERAGLSGVLIGESFSYTRELNNKLKNLRGNLNENITNGISNIENQISRVRSLIGLVDRDLNKLPEVERNLVSIERRFRVNESIYTLLLEKRAETEIKKASTTTNHQIYDAAEVNPVPISPSRSRNYALGLALGFSLPLLILIVWSIFYHKVSDLKELEEVLEIPIIGTIPREKNNQNPLDHNVKSMTTESFRNIRSNLAIRFNFKDKGVILVTSTKPGEGKTYTSIKIASIYSALGKKTLILGMDLRKPQLHKELNLNNDKGVTTFLFQDGDEWEHLIQSTEKENLDVMSAGPYTERSSELINTPKFENLIAALKNKYDFLIIDTSPIGLVSETLDLTKYSDINLFMFRQNFSFLNQAYVANDLKNKFEIKNLFAIINDTQSTGIGYYNYGYGYGYYSNYDSYVDKPKNSRFKNFFKRKI